MRFKLIISLLFLMISGILYSQEKVEREYRFQDEDIPAAALKFMNALEFDKKLRWYREESQTEISIEMKSEIFDEDVSIEFDTLGNLQDVEIEIEDDDIDEELLNKIEEYLNSKHDRFKIIKVQYQLSGSEEQVLKWLSSEPDLDKVPHQFELVVRTSTEGKHEKWEYLFTQDGSLISRLKFQLKNTDILDY